MGRQKLKVTLGGVAGVASVGPVASPIEPETTEESTKLPPPPVGIHSRSALTLEAETGGSVAPPPEAMLSPPLPFVYSDSPLL